MTDLHGADLRVVRDRVEVLAHADLRIAPGEVHGVIGPNGAGKSTLLRALAATLPIAGGRLRAGDDDIARMPSRRRARVRALLPQDAGSADDLLVRELAMTGRHAHRRLLGSPAPGDRAAADAALETAGVAHLADRAVRTLSGGQRRLAFIAKALAQDPRILLLDEPLAALDPRHQLEVVQLIRRLARRGVGVGVVLHDLELASRMCDRITVVSGGRVVAVGPPDVVLTADVLARVYGVEARVAPDPLTGGLRIALLAPLDSEAPAAPAATRTPQEAPA